jgi:hypothetical protein
MGRMHILSIFLISVSLLLSSSGLSADFDVSRGNAQSVHIDSSLVSLPENNAYIYPVGYNHRLMRQYQYFPSVCVYHDANRGLYFFQRDHQWCIAVSLPIDLRTELDEYVTLKMESDKPYLFNDQHKRQYPSGN